MNKLIKKAFTLIELLVVIAIIGILSGLIVVSMGGMTTKASIAKAQVFSNSLRNSLMMNIIAEYKLDGNANDTWGANNGTINGTPITKEASDCVYGKCLSFNGSTDFIEVADNSVLDISGELTISYWAKIIGTNSNNYGGINKYANMTGYVDRRAYGSWFLANTTRIVAVVSNDGTAVAGHITEANSNASIGLNNWTHILISYKPSSYLRIYINGSLDSEITTGVIASIYNSNAPLWIGTNFDKTEAIRRINGFIDDVRLYNAVISTSQIKQQYYAGLNSLLVNGSINAKEYSLRINSIAQR